MNETIEKKDLGERKSKKILVVDDEAIIRKTCNLALTRSGYEVETVDNGVEALKILSKHDFDIIVLDLKMPLMGGMELLETLKQDFPHIKVIVMTGYATIENAIEAMKRNACDFILKPFRADQIRMTVEKCTESIDLGEEIRDLKIANQKLRDLQAMKDRFIAITSHELRTPVSHIKGYLTILNDDTYKDTITPEEREEFVKIIHTAVEDLEHIVLSMFEITQLENNSLKLNLEKISLNEISAQVIKEFSLITRDRNHTITFKSEKNLPAIYGDRLRLKQMITALIENAIKYTPDGGIIQVETYSEKSYSFLSVKDNGIGMDESEKSKIFEKFYEIQDPDHHSTSKTNFMGGGLGLGLSISKAIVEAHKGRMKVDSVPGKGTVFTVILPIQNWNYEEGNVSEHADGYEESTCC